MALIPCQHNQYVYLINIFLNVTCIFTAHIRRMGKVLFSQVPAYSRGGGTPVLPVGVPQSYSTLILSVVDVPVLLVGVPPFCQGEGLPKFCHGVPQFYWGDSPILLWGGKPILVGVPQFYQGMYPNSVGVGDTPILLGVQFCYGALILSGGIQTSVRGRRREDRVPQSGHRIGYSQSGPGQGLHSDFKSNIKDDYSVSSWKNTHVHMNGKARSKKVFHQKFTISLCSAMSAISSLLYILDLHLPVFTLNVAKYTCSLVDFPLLLNFKTSLHLSILPCECNVRRSLSSLCLITLD